MAITLRQRGSILVMVLSALAILGAVLLASSNLFGTIRNISKSQLQISSRALLTQAVYSLNAESGDTDNDGQPEPLAMASGGNGTAGTCTGIPEGATAACFIPSSSAAPKTDAWGSYFLYCAWDNGSTNNSAGRYGGDNPATTSSTVLAVVSAGSNKVIETTCAQAKTGQFSSDDLVMSLTIQQRNMGVSGTVFWGDPVAKFADLPMTGNVVNTVRLALDTGQIYRWNGTAWVQIGGGAGWQPVSPANLLPSTSALPTTGVSSGDVRYVFDPNSNMYNAYIYYGGQWSQLAGGSASGALPTCTGGTAGTGDPLSVFACVQTPTVIANSTCTWNEGILSTDGSGNYYACQDTMTNTDLTGSTCTMVNRVTYDLNGNSYQCN
jgi:hypothetical protein